MSKRSVIDWELILVIITCVVISIIILFIVSLFVLFINHEEQKRIDNQLFKCNPYYFGAEYVFPYRCPNTFINATGNYCNGILVCENELRGVSR